MPVAFLARQDNISLSFANILGYVLHSAQAYLTGGIATVLCCLSGQINWQRAVFWFVWLRVFLFFIRLRLGFSIQLCACETSQLRCEVGDDGPGGMLVSGFRTIVARSFFRSFFFSPPPPPPPAHCQGMALYSLLFFSAQYPPLLFCMLVCRFFVLFSTNPA